MHHDVIVVGAGIAGLALARELRARGHAPVVFERARGVGGRCATRRVCGQPADHGLPYLHGRSRGFLAELDAVSALAVPDWPVVVIGDGLACRPEAFSGTDRRLVFGEGVSCLAKHLARGLDVRLETEVVALHTAADPVGRAGHVWGLRLATGETLRANTVVLAMPAPSAIEMLRGMGPLPAAITAQLPLLELVRMVPCLAVIARYPSGVPTPEWDASFPGSSAAVHGILHDSSKRDRGARLTLVFQARPGFSAKHLESPVDSWTRTLLDEAATLHGAWIAAPELVQSHVWRKARVAAGSELAGPLVIQLDEGARLGVAGDGFHNAGGVEGAYWSGIALAERLVTLLPKPT